LAKEERFIIADLGVHILDICRFLLGEVATLYCQTLQINPTIKGEDVADVLMKMQSGASCFAEMSYASILEKETFPQKIILVEGEKSAVHLTNDFEIRITDSGLNKRTFVEIATPKFYQWANPDYAVVHSSIVECNLNILNDLIGNGQGETSGRDNLETTRLVYACYESAQSNKSINLM